MFKASKLFLLLIYTPYMLLSGNISAMYSDPTYLQLPDIIKASSTTPKSPIQTDDEGSKLGQYIKLFDLCFMEGADIHVTRTFNISINTNKILQEISGEYFITEETCCVFDLSDENPENKNRIHRWASQNGHNGSELRITNNKI